MTTLKGRDVFAQILHDYGVSHVFFQDAVFRAGMKEAGKLGVKGIMTHSEGAAGSMADGYARASGRVGVCMAQSIGAANLVGGLMDAWLANSPVLAITGKKPPFFLYKNSYQETSHHEMFMNVSKFQAEVTDTSAQLPFLLRQCFREASTGRPRPVHLDIIGRDAVETEYDDIPGPILTEPVYGSFPSHRPAADKETVANAAKMLAESEKPVIIAGRGAHISNAGEAILALAQKCDIPVITTPDGKTLIDETDDLWSGIIGIYGNVAGNRTAKNADLVIYIGAQTSDHNTFDWQIPGEAGRVIQINIASEELGRTQPNSQGLWGDARTVTEQLTEAASAQKHDTWRKQVREWVSESTAEYDAAAASADAPIHTARLCRELEKALPNDAILVVDTGYTTRWSANAIRMKKTQNYFRATGSLGWSFPGSIGVKCGAPDRPVVNLTGDGGFFYYLAEMETLVRYGINTVTVIDNNGILSACVPQTRGVYSNDLQKGMSMIQFAPVPFAEIAQKIGLHAVRVTDPSMVAPAVEEALACGKPALVEVITAPTEPITARRD